MDHPITKRYSEEIRRSALPALLFVDDLAFLLRCSERRIRSLIRSGFLPAVVLGRRYLVRREDLLGWLAPADAHACPKARLPSAVRTPSMRKS